MNIGKGIIGGLGLGGALSVGGLLFGSLRNAPRNVSRDYQAQGLGLEYNETRALGYASRQITGSDENLLSAVTALTNALYDVERGGEFASLGLNQNVLQGLSRIEAFSRVLEAVRGMPLNSNLYRENFNSLTGGGYNYNVATQTGADDLWRFYNESLEMSAGFTNDALLAASRGLIRLTERFDIEGQRISGIISDPLLAAIEALSPLVTTFSELIANLLRQITPERVKAFGDFVGKFTGAVTDVTSGDKGLLEAALDLTEPEWVSDFEKSGMNLLEYNNAQAAAKRGGRSYRQVFTEDTVPAFQNFDRKLLGFYKSVFGGLGVGGFKNQKIDVTITNTDDSATVEATASEGINVRTRR